MSSVHVKESILMDVVENIKYNTCSAVFLDMYEIILYYEASAIAVGLLGGIRNINIVGMKFSKYLIGNGELPNILSNALGISDPYMSMKSVIINLGNEGRDNMSTIFQTTFSNAFLLMKMYKFQLKFHWSLFPTVQLTIFQHLFR